MTTIHDELQGNYVGVTLIGCVLVAFLYGITVAQASLLCARNGADSLILRTLIMFLWFNDGAHYAIAIWSAYHLFDLQDIIYNSAWCFRGIIFVSGITHLGIKSIYIYRTWILSKSKLALALLIGSALTTFSISMKISFSLRQESNLVQLLASLSHEIYASLASLAFSDAVVSVSICWSLAHCRTVSPRTEHIISVLMLYAIECGLLMSVSSIACLVTYATLMPDNATFLAIFFVIPKLGINSLFATLNARYALRESANSLVGLGDSVVLARLQRRRFRDRLAHSKNAPIISNVGSEVQIRSDYRTGQQQDTISASSC
ncbi:uncharacterized protein B0H18DRAFT_491528 [Fomitopsis serialis]|uniref:uncharacterized protein n=1 Tax=Fomitopsis serialis TaxID=139415 RepID=UPI002007570A|nr:uncharacterized protein B0H18DRAFT_491528 [Neoantrodia serialis]KAH9934882.1 hypothetical protein B0H18DRAFT_491528 [Neoantrodia serialis]